MEWLPNFFIAGAPKCGTSTLHRWLAAHPQALGAREKETCFLADPGTHTYRRDFHVSNGMASWSTAFDPPRPETRVIFDATPDYLYSKTALRMIPDMPGAPKCLFVLREPAAQIFSIFRYFQNNWNWIAPHMSFSDYIDALRGGGARFGGNELAERALGNAQYLDHLAPWRARLGEERLKVMTFERLTRQSREAMEEIAQWLGLDPGFYDGFDFAPENQSYVPRSRALQRINVALRGTLPRGAAYRHLRALYRRVNTRAPAAPLAQERRVLTELRRDFRPANRALADAFGLDLSAWEAVA